MTDHYAKSDDYYCLTCHHTTQDHMAHGRGSCLLEGCECGEMKQGEKYVKPKYRAIPPEGYESALDKIASLRNAKK